MVFVVGRGGGKDALTAAMCVVEAVNFDRREIAHMQPGERAMIGCFGPTSRQSGIAFGYITGFFHEVPALKALIVKETLSTLRVEQWRGHRMLL